MGARNIQRGRDFGLPGYNKYRAYCGLNYAYSFDDLTNIPHDVREKLQYLYANVDDIDLFTGVMSEFPVKDGVIGHTASCIIGSGMRDRKFGDRFYYETDNKLTGYPIEDLYEIRKASLARIICDNSDIYFIQAHPFLLSNEHTNPLVDCADLPVVDLTNGKKLSNYY